MNNVCNVDNDLSVAKCLLFTFFLLPELRGLVQSNVGCANSAVAFINPMNVMISENEYIKSLKS